MAELKFLRTEHPIYTAQKSQWEEYEKRLRGGKECRDDLVKFEWEDKDGTHHDARKKQATYINFPELFMLVMTGHLSRHAPEADAALNFGTLGTVKRISDNALPNPAELIFYNADGQGQDGSQWNNFWFDASHRAGGTGHRWMFAEGPSVAPGTRDAEIAGARPYLIEFSPLDVPNWHYVGGVLQYAMIRLNIRQPTVNDKGELEGNEPQEFMLLLTRRGWQGFGAEYANGGWWLFTGKDELATLNINGVDVAQTGNWDITLGDIPLFPLFYERDVGSKLLPNMSRSGIDGLSQVAFSYMNLSSAADYDAWDAAQSVLFFLGVNPDNFSVAVKMWKEGNKMIGVPAGIGGLVPTVQDGSAGAVAAEVFDRRLTNKVTEAMKLAAQEVTSAPDSSGLSKSAGFGEMKSPRLATMASELETAQNTAIYFLELRWGTANAATQPSGSVTWTRKFDLLPVIDDIERVFKLETEAGVRSKSLDSQLIIQAIKESRLITDETLLTTIENELKAASDAAAQAKQQSESLLSDFGIGGGNSTNGDQSTVEDAPVIPAGTSGA